MKIKKWLPVLVPLFGMLLVETLLLFVPIAFPPYVFSLTLLSICVFVWIQLVLHEAGHLFFGWATGYRFLSYRIFSSVILRENGQLVFKRQAINEAVAQCLMVPDKEWDPNDYPYKLYLSGGIIFNAIFSLSALFLLTNENVPVVQILLFSGIGLFLAFSNGIPKGMNDGAVLKKCNRHPGYRRMMYHQLRTVYYLTESRPLNALPEESFEQSEEVALSDPFSLYVMRLEYYKYLEQSQFKQAREVLEKQWELKDELVPVDRWMIQAEKLFCVSIQQSVEEAREMYLQTEMQLIQKYEQVTFKRIFSTYYLYVENNPTKALVWIEAGLQLGSSKSIDHTLQVETSVLEWLKQTALKKLEPHKIAND